MICNDNLSVEPFVLPWPGKADSKLRKQSKTKVKPSRPGEVVTCSVGHLPIHYNNFEPALLSISQEVDQDLFEGGGKRHNILT